MAIIGKIRSKSGLLLVIVGGALAAFVLGDFFKNGCSGGGVNDLAVINGEEIAHREFSIKVEEQQELMKQNSGNENPTPEETFQVMMQTWEQLLKDKIMQVEYDELGLSVTPSELTDNLIGRYPHQWVLQNFKDPETGQFNPSQVEYFIKDFENRDAEQKRQWLSIEDYIKSDVLNKKYSTLVKKAYYMPKAFLKKDYELKNTTVNARFFAQMYSTISDSDITVTDADYEKYYEENKQKYEIEEEAREINYVVFEVLPTIEAIQNEVAELYKEFAITDMRIQDFVNANSDVRYDSTFFKSGQFPAEIDSVVFKTEVGSVIGPYESANSLNIAKIVDIQSRPDSMKASHILFTYTGTEIAQQTQQTLNRSKDEAEAMADSVLNILNNNPALFDTLITTLSDDPGKETNNGDLDWFADGMVIPSINNACLNGNVGDMVVVESYMGFHIIKVTGKLESIKKARIAVIQRSIVASEATRKTIYAEASKFAANNRSAEAFEKAANDLGVRNTVVRKMSNNISGLKSPRELVRWAFDENTEVGAVTEKILTFENKHVVALLKNVYEKGFATLEQVKGNTAYGFDIAVKNEKKAEMLFAKIEKELSTTKDIYKLAAKYNLQVDTLNAFSFATYSIPKYGVEHGLTGTMFSMKSGQMSGAIKGNSAVYVVVVDQITPAPATDVYTMIQMQLKQAFEGRVDNGIYDAIKRNAEIIDNRINWY